MKTESHDKTGTQKDEKDIMIDQFCALPMRILKWLFFVPKYEDIFFLVL